MWKNLSDLSQISAVLSANLAVSAVTGWLDNCHLVIKILVAIGELAVALATVYYILRKARKLGK